MTNPHRKPAIRTAGRDDAQVLAHVLTEAFLHGDLAAWLVPHLDTRYRIYQSYFALQTEHALEHGTVEITCDGKAAAVWYAIDGQPPPELPDHAARLAQITGDFHRRFAALEHAMHRQHPNQPAHHYLALLAVHPDRQGHGHGTALLTHHHAHLDATATPAYLEATGLRNRRLYTRHHYRPKTPFTIAPAGPALYPMWRRPNPVTQSLAATCP